MSAPAVHPCQPVESALPVTCIRPRPAWRVIDLPELWRYRDLIAVLALRDLQVRYKQTILGVGWAVVQPVLAMLVLSAVFGGMMGVSHHMDGVPYPVFLYAGLLPWLFFTAAVNAASNSLVNNAGMLGKVYLPRLAMPLAAVGAPLLDYAIASIVLAGLMLWYQVPVTASLLLLPFAMLAAALAAAAAGVALAALVVTYRDVKHIVPFALQIGLFVTPVIVPQSTLGPRWAGFLPLNPMTGVVTLSRAAVIGSPLDLPAVVVSLTVSLLLLVGGLIYFARMERCFADVV